MRRTLLYSAGWTSFALGAVGILVPLLPTTVFWIVAAWCRMASAPERAGRLLAHPRFGHPIARFLQAGEICRPGKIAAAGGMASSYGLWLVLSTPSPPVAILVSLVLSGIAAWLVARPESGASTEEDPSLGADAGVRLPRVSSSP